MILELQSTIDRASSVSILLAKSGDQYTATLMVKTNEGEAPLPPVQVVASIDEIDNAVSMAFNEVSEAYASTADQISEFKKAADANAEAAKKKATPAKKNPVKTATKKVATKKVAKPAPTKPEPAPTKVEEELDEETNAAMLKLFPDGL